MAEERDKTMIADEKQAEATPKPASGGSKKFLLFGIIGVGAIVVGVVLALFVVRPMMSKTPESGAKPDKPAVSHDTKDSKSGGDHGAATGGGSAVYAVKDIVVNPASTGGTRFLSVSFAFELKSAALVSECEAKELAIRDALITILSAKTVAQLTDPKEKEIVRYQIRKRVSDILKTDQLAQVFYTDFVLQ